MTRDEAIDARIAELLAEAPLLTDEQIQRVAAVLIQVEQAHASSRRDAA